MTTAAPAQSLRDRVAEHLAKNPRAMTIMMAREWGIPEAEIVRNFPAEQVTELKMTPDAVEPLIRALEPLGRVHVIASNDSVTLESYGFFGGYSTMGPFLNVQTETLDMHIKYRELASAFAVIKPSHQDGQTTYSIQFFDKNGKSSFKVFLYKSVTDHAGGDVEKSIGVWKDITAKFKL